MKFANKALFVFSLLLSSAFASAQTFDLQESRRALNENPAAYVVGGASCYAASIMGGQAAQYVLVSAALTVPAAATFCIPAAALLHAVTLCDSVERLTALYTGHQPVITKYNPTAYLASFLVNMFDSSYIFKDPEDSEWNRAFEQGQHDMAVIASITNGLVSAWKLLGIGKNLVAYFQKAQDTPTESGVATQTTTPKTREIAIQVPPVGQGKEYDLKLLDAVVSGDEKLVASICENYMGGHLHFEYAEKTFKTALYLARELDNVHGLFTARVAPHFKPDFDKEQAYKHMIGTILTLRNPENPSELYLPWAGRFICGDSSLHSAVETGNLEMVKKIVSYNRVHPNHVKPRDGTPDQLAVKHGYLEIAEYLRFEVSIYTPEQEQSIASRFKLEYQQAKALGLFRFDTSDLDALAKIIYQESDDAKFNLASVIVPIHEARLRSEEMCGSAMGALAMVFSKIPLQEQEQFMNQLFSVQDFFHSFDYLGKNKANFAEFLSKFAYTDRGRILELISRVAIASNQLYRLKFQNVFLEYLFQMESIEEQEAFTKQFLEIYHLVDTNDDGYLWVFKDILDSLFKVGAPQRQNLIARVRTFQIGNRYDLKMAVDSVVKGLLIKQ